MKKIPVIIVMAVFFGVFLQATAQAESLKCEGVPKVSMNIDWGNLYVDIGYGQWQLCSVRKELFDVDVEVCKALHKSLLLAEAMGRKVRFRFKADNNETCNDIGDWGEPALFPYHIDFLR